MTRTRLPAPRTAAVFGLRVAYANPDAVADDAYQRAAAVLCAAERARAERFAFAALRREYVIAHALVRGELARASGVAAAAWRFRAGRNGRPEIAAPLAAAGLQFSLSHTSGLVACATARERAVGVDVERCDRATRVLPIADRFFAPAEAAALRALPADRRRRRFAAYWSLKEAYLKARGDGLTVSPAVIAFEFAADGAIRACVDPADGDDARRWHFALRSVGPDHLLAVCVERAGDEVPRITYTDVD